MASHGQPSGSDPVHPSGSSGNSGNEPAVQSRTQLESPPIQVPRGTRPSGGRGHTRQNAIAGPVDIGTPGTMEVIRQLGIPSDPLGRDQERERLAHQRVEELRNNENSYAAFLQSSFDLDDEIDSFFHPVEQQPEVADRRGTASPMLSPTPMRPHLRPPSAVLNPATDAYALPLEGSDSPVHSHDGSESVHGALGDPSRPNLFDDDRQYFLPSMSLFDSSNNEDPEDENAAAQSNNEDPEDENAAAQSNNEDPEDENVAAQTVPTSPNEAGRPEQPPAAEASDQAPAASTLANEANPFEEELAHYPWNPTTSFEPSIGVPAPAPVPLVPMRPAPPRPSRIPNPEMPPQQMLDEMLAFQMDYSQRHRERERQQLDMTQASMPLTLPDWPLEGGYGIPNANAPMAAARRSIELEQERQRVRERNERQEREQRLFPYANYMTGHGSAQQTSGFGQPRQQPSQDGFTNTNVRNGLRRRESMMFRQDATAVPPSTRAPAQGPDGQQPLPHQGYHGNVDVGPTEFSTVRRLGPVAPPTPPQSRSAMHGGGAPPPLSDITPARHVPGPVHDVRQMQAPQRGHAAPVPTHRPLSEMHTVGHGGDRSRAAPSQFGAGRHPASTLTAATTTAVLTTATATARMTRAATMASTRPRATTQPARRASASSQPSSNTNPARVPPSMQSAFSVPSASPLASAASAETGPQPPWMAGTPVSTTGPSASMTATTMGRQATTAGPSRSVSVAATMADGDNWVSAATSAPIPIPGALPIPDASDAWEGSVASGSGPFMGADVPLGPNHLLAENDEVALAMNVAWRAFLRNHHLPSHASPSEVDGDLVQEFLRPYQETTNRPLRPPPRDRRD